MILFTSFGGVLADLFDKRKLMIALDTWNSFVALFYLVALHYRSVSILYFVSFIRNSFVAIYEPITRSIVPLLMENDDDLKSAVTMNGMAWALTLTFGGTLAGWTAARLGVASCFLVDTVSYILSAVVIYMVRGRYCVREEDGVAASAEKSSDVGSKWGWRCVKLFRNKRLCMVFTPVVSLVKLSMELLGYLVTCKFTMLVFMKVSYSIFDRHSVMQHDELVSRSNDVPDRFHDNVILHSRQKRRLATSPEVAPTSSTFTTLTSMEMSLQPRHVSE